ncbi:hypothetical protein BJX61DRAFT_494752 [Aspergillus egyptiacus]|nr:hypothetical protein BJX61DRAFT_494752 [Aspergillus egyptiacus]
MADRQQVMIRFTDIDKYFEGKDGIEKILKEDTGREQFIMTSTVPPMYIGLTDRGGYWKATNV